MITTIIRGGLGNQLFQYASAYALAKRLNQPLTLDISFFPKQTLRGYKLDKLMLAEHSITYGEKDGLLKKTYKNRNINGVIRRSEFSTLPIKNGLYLIDHAGCFTPKFFQIDAENVFLNGYYQSEKYFHNVREDILKQFLPAYRSELEYWDMLKDITSVNSVAVHIRRGDFINESNSGFHYVLRKEYYNKAIQMIKNRISNPVFFCFSDDIEWVKQNVNSIDNLSFVSLSTNHSDIDEMMLMRNCSHIITANSTFSWWAAWLNEHEDAIKIVPEKAYGNDHMIPNEWIKIAIE